MFRKAGQVIVNGISAIFKGELLVRLHAGQYFLHILYIFFLMALTIWISLMTDAAMKKVDDNKLRLKDLEIVATMKKYELERKNDRKVVTETLQSLGSSVCEPEQPAYKIKK